MKENQIEFGAEFTIQEAILEEYKKLVEEMSRLVEANEPIQYVDQSNLEFHEKAAGTFNEQLSKGSTPPPHAH